MNKFHKYQDWHNTHYYQHDEGSGFFLALGFMIVCLSIAAYILIQP